MSYLCYFLTNDENSRYTYVGITNNFKRRIRQHNRGSGAKYTKRYKNWRPFIHVCGFTEKKHSLQFEWAMKHKRRSGGISGRIKTLEYLLKIEKWTKRAPNNRDMNLVIKVGMKEETYRKHIKLSKVDFDKRREKQKDYATFIFKLK